ncbi:MAG: hypothetical protein K0Q87_1692 [Neobacillus sp.]|jgi:hypothetical protein|nr:hypothetical protein [Neobacillus sp.]
MVLEGSVAHLGSKSKHPLDNRPNRIITNYIEISPIPKELGLFPITLTHHVYLLDIRTFTYSVR